LSSGRRRDSSRTKREILFAAEQEFAEKGFYGARVDQIAKLANINKRMIYEYFGNKEELYKTVLVHVYGRLGERETKLLDQEIDRILASGRAADRDIETAGVVVHEVTHEYLSFGRPDKYISFPFHQVLQDEKSAYRAQSAIYILLDTISMHGLHDPSWTMADAPKLREKAINENAKNSTEKARQAHGRRSGKK